MKKIIKTTSEIIPTKDVNQAAPNNFYLYIIKGRINMLHRVCGTDSQWAWVALHDPMTHANGRHSSFDAAIRSVVDRDAEVFEFDSYAEMLQWAAYIATHDCTKHDV